MVEYKVTGKNKIECANDYIENHLGEQIKYLNNNKVDCGWINHKAKSTGENLWRSNEDMLSIYYSVNEIANAMYRMSHSK